MALLLLLNSLAVSRHVPQPREDLAHQARAQAESLKDDLKSFLINPEGNELLISNTNTCFNTIDDVIETIETNTKLVEDVAEDIEDLLETVEGFVTGTSASLQNCVKLMRGVDIIIPKLVSDKNTCGSVHSLAEIIAELSNRDDDHYQPVSEVLTKVENILTMYSSPQYNCTGDEAIPIVRVVGPLILELAKLYRLIRGNDEDWRTSEKEFGQKIVVSQDLIQ